MKSLLFIEKVFLKKHGEAELRGVEVFNIALLRRNDSDQSWSRDAHVPVATGLRAGRLQEREFTKRWAKSNRNAVGTSA